MDFQEQEQAKSEAWPIIRGDFSLDLKAQALERIITAHYWRAVTQFHALPATAKRKIEGKFYCGKNSTFGIDRYTRHWLAANSNIVHPDILRRFTSLYGYEAEPSRYLPKGCTSYRLQP